MRRGLLAPIAACFSVVAVVSACLQSSGPGPGAGICAEVSRTPLLTAHLSRMTPSDPITIARGSRAWVRMTVPPNRSGLFGNVADVRLYTVHAAAAPRTAIVDGLVTPQDPWVPLPAMRWQSLNAAPGAWRVYSEEDPTIEIVSCASA